MLFHRSVALAAFASLAVGTPGVVFAQSPSPEPSPNAAAVATAAPSTAPRPATPSTAQAQADRSRRVHLGIVSCEGAPFYSWPDHAIVPSGSTYPPARTGEAINVIGDGTLANNGMTLYETTIDVVAPFGVGKHYYISAFCINAG